MTGGIDPLQFELSTDGFGVTLFKVNSYENRYAKSINSFCSPRKFPLSERDLYFRLFSDRFHATYNGSIFEMPDSKLSTIPDKPFA
jgi:hypothetical protein